SALWAFAGLVLLAIFFDVFHLACSFVESALRSRHLDWWDLRDFFLLIISQMWIVVLFWLTTWPPKIRGVAPITFAALLLFALGPFIGSRIGNPLGQLPSMGLNGMFVLMALPA